jgi:hypothetical protein
MANTMTTYVKICNLNEETFNRAKVLFETERENNADVKVVEHFNKIFGTEFNNTDNYPDRAWMDENIGAKWIRIEFGNVEFSPEVDVFIESAWNVPTEYIQKVVEVLNEYDKNIVAYGTYEDEGYSPIGAFVYGFDYDDIEDYDEVDSQRMWDDDDYNEEIMDKLHDHRDSLYEGYLEVKKEREEDDRNG